MKRLVAVLVAASTMIGALPASAAGTDPSPPPDRTLERLDGSVPTIEASSPEVATASVGDAAIDVYAFADARRLDIIVDVTGVRAYPAAVSVRLDGVPELRLALDAWTDNGDGTATESYYTVLGARPGSHRIDAVVDWGTESEIVSLTIDVPDVAAGVLTLTRAQGSNPYTIAASAVPFTAIVPKDAGVCPTTVLETSPVGAQTWTAAPLVWTARYGTDTCDIDLTALAPPTHADYRVRTVGASGEHVSEIWPIWFGQNSTGATSGFTWQALSPDLLSYRVGTLLGTDAVGALNLAVLGPRVPAPGSGYQLVWIQQGTGWGRLRVYGPGDWDGDGQNDVLATDIYGKLLLYRGTGVPPWDSGGKPPLRSAVQVGNGWGPYRIVPTGDLTGDRRPDLLAVDNRGALWLYPGAGAGKFAARRQVGNGWGSFQLYGAGDMNRDGRVDILGVDPQGKLWFYAGRGNGTFAMRVQVGSGWQYMRLASGADLTGDGLNDLVGTDLEGRDWLYPGKIGGSFAMRTPLTTYS